MRGHRGAGPEKETGYSLLLFYSVAISCPLLSFLPTEKGELLNVVERPAADTEYR